MDNPLCIFHAANIIEANAKEIPMKYKKSTSNDPYQLFCDLDPARQLLLAATLTERMLPNYLLFSEVSGFGDGKVLRDALNIVWEKLLVKNLKLNIDKQLEKIEPNIPDVADFDLFGVYPALDSAMALNALLSGMAGNGDSEDNAAALLDVCKLSRASVSKVAELELTAQDIEISEAQLTGHELMIYETEFFGELIATISVAAKPDKALIKQCRQRALADGISNIGIEVE